MTKRVTRKSRSRTHKVRDLGVASSAVAGVKGGKLLEAATKGKVLARVDIHSTA